MSPGRIGVLALLAAIAAASAIAVVHARHQSRIAFVELTRLEAERDELNIEFGRLQLEQATWAETNRIEQIAATRLGMVFPGPGETRVVRR